MAGSTGLGAQQDQPGTAFAWAPGVIPDIHISSLFQLADRETQAQRHQVIFLKLLSCKYQSWALTPNSDTKNQRTHKSLFCLSLQTLGIHRTAGTRFHLSRGFSIGAVLHFWGHSAISGDIFGCHSLGIGRCDWHLVGRGHRCR